MNLFKIHFTVSQMHFCVSSFFFFLELSFLKWKAGVAGRRPKSGVSVGLSSRVCVAASCWEKENISVADLCFRGGKVDLFSGLSSSRGGKHCCHWNDWKHWRLEREMNSRTAEKLLLLMDKNEFCHGTETGERWTRVGTKEKSRTSTQGVLLWFKLDGWSWAEPPISCCTHRP